MMDYKILEDYLDEIYRYLPLKKGQDEILSEIKSHILEKVQYESEKITEDELKITIDNYGSPKTIAEKYMENYQIIAPAYKKYLIRYSGLLFIMHYSLIILANFIDLKMMLFPFFYIPVIGEHYPTLVQLILLIPMIFFYDFGLVCLFLYFITQNKKEIKLPWFRLNLSWLVDSQKNIRKPKIVYLILMVSGFIAVLYIYSRFNTLFILSLGWEDTSGWQKIISLFNPTVSLWLSLAVIVIYLLEILHYLIRFFTESIWIKLIKDSIILLIMWFIISYPFRDALIDFPYLDLYNIFFTVVLFLTIIAGFNFLISLIEILKSRFGFDFRSERFI